MDIKKIIRIGIINTLRMNIHYFGVGGGVLYPRILAGRNLKIVALSGEVKAPKRIGCVKIGINDTAINDIKFQRSMWQNGGVIIFDGKASLGAGTKISNKGILKFGDNVRVTANTSIICYKQIEIGKNTLISWDVLMMDNDLHKIYSLDLDHNDRQYFNEPEKIQIGDHCWIGCRCLLLKGTRIPANTIVAAASTITQRYERENTIISSNRILKENVEWRT